MTLLLAPLALAAMLAPPVLQDESTSAPDWAQWRGPTRDGSCTGPAWPAELKEDSLERLWRVEMGPSYASPIVAGDRVFTVETSGEQDEVVRALDRGTGEQLWETTWKGSMKVPFFAKRNGSWVRSTPAYDGEYLYVGGIRDRLVCLAGATGKVRWDVDFLERDGKGLPDFGMVCSPLIDGEHLYIQAGGALAKLDKTTGETIWRGLEDSGGMDSPFSSPVIAELHGTRQLLISTRESLCGVDLETGGLLWEAPIKTFRGMNILTPTAVGDAVFTSAYGGRSQLLEPEKGEEGWSVSQSWESRPRGYMTSPVVIDGYAYLYLQSNRFSCVRLSDGEVGWISEPMGDEYWSLVSQGDRILALTHSGELLLIQADPSEYRELGRVTVAEQETWAHLGVSGDELFVRELEAMTVYRWR